MRLVRAQWLAAFALAVAAFSYASGDALQLKLESLRARESGVDTDTNALEKEYLALLYEYSDEADAGRIYAELTEMYHQVCLVDPNPVVTHARRTLEYPLDPLTKMRVYIALGDGLHLTNRLGPEILRIHLLGLKLAAENDVPAERVPVPIPTMGSQAVSMARAQGDEELIRRLEEESQRQTDAYEAAVRTNEMVGLQDTFYNLVVYTCTVKSLGASELRAVATDVLGESPLVDEILAKFAESIASGAAGRLSRSVAPSIARELVDEADEPGAFEASSTSSAFDSTVGEPSSPVEPPAPPNNRDFRIPRALWLALPAAALLALLLLIRRKTGKVFH